MMYIAPEDQDIDTTDAVLRIAWTDRRQLRIEEMELKAKIKALNVFIETYVERAKPIFGQKAPQVSIIYPANGSRESWGKDLCAHERLFTGVKRVDPFGKSDATVSVTNECMDCGATVNREAKS